ncbi:MAG: haloacid dehalogenase type II [Patescibacteria group bacterium]
MINFNKYEVLTFDCYGTLIDWENGILAALKPVLLDHNVRFNDNQILELYADLESKIEKNEFIKYKEVLRRIMKQLAEKLAFSLSPSQEDCLIESLKNWEPFPDTVDALKDLKKKFKLAIISNIDDDLFVFSNRHLKVKFDYIITAEQARSYKPSLNNFKIAISKIGIPSERILHVAQSIYHDIVPAKTLGISTVWVNRRKGKEGFGATPPADSQPDLEVPDLKKLVQIIGL